MSGETRLTVLDNGARVITSSLAGAESVSVGIWVGVGGRHEPAVISGISHFLEHMLFKGTKRRSARAISQDVEGRGGDLNAFTQEDSTCFYARLPHEQMRRAVSVLADMYLNARISPAEVERERMVIIEEMKMYRDQAQYLAQEEAMRALWSRHALGRPLAGRAHTLLQIDASALTGFRDANYVPANTVFAFAGRLDHDACVAAVSARLGKLPPGCRPRLRPVALSSPQAPLVRISRDIQQVQVVAAWRLFGRQDPRRHALRLLNALMGENMSSRLFQVLRERFGLAYSIHSHFQLFAETGLFAISAGLEQGTVEKALALIGREVSRICRDEVSPAELRRGRDYILGQFRLAMESPGNQMQWLGETVLHYHHPISPASVVEGVGKVTPADLRRLAREIFDPGRLSLSVVCPMGDRSDVKRLRRLLTGE